VHYVWTRKWESIHIGFIISRYLPFIALPLVCYSILYGHNCGTINNVVNVLYTTCIVSAEVTLALRTYALWSRNQRVLAILIGLLVAFVIAAGLVGALGKFSLPGDSESPYECAYGTSRIFAFALIFLMIHEIILQSMNTWRKFRTYRDVQSRTLSTLYWDGIMYMFWIILLTAVNMAVTLSAPVPYIPSLLTAQVALQSTFASRIFFNLRECDERIHDGGSRTDILLDSLRFSPHSVGTTQSRTEYSAF